MTVYFTNVKITIYCVAFFGRRIFMTVQQEAYALIDSISDESVKYIVELIHNMKPSFLAKKENENRTDR